MDISDSKEFSFVFHKELVVENPADVSIDPKTLGGAVEIVLTFFLGNFVLVSVGIRHCIYKQWLFKTVCLVCNYEKQL